MKMAEGSVCGHSTTHTKKTHTKTQGIGKPIAHQNDHLNCTHLVFPSGFELKDYHFSLFLRLFSPATEATDFSNLPMILSLISPLLGGRVWFFLGVDLDHLVFSISKMGCDQLWSRGKQRKEWRVYERGEKFCFGAEQSEWWGDYSGFIIYSCLWGLWSEDWITWLPRFDPLALFGSLGLLGLLGSLPLCVEMALLHPCVKGQEKEWRRGRPSVATFSWTWS